MFSPSRMPRIAMYRRDSAPENRSGSGAAMSATFGLRPTLWWHSPRHGCHRQPHAPRFAYGSPTNSDDPGRGSIDQSLELSLRDGAGAVLAKVWMHALIVGLSTA